METREEEWEGAAKGEERSRGGAERRGNSFNCELQLAKKIGVFPIIELDVPRILGVMGGPRDSPEDSKILSMSAVMGKVWIVW